MIEEVCELYKYVIALDDEFDHEELKKALENFPAHNVKDFDHKVFVIGTAKYGMFCSILWQCQKFGEVRCELSKA